MKDINRTMKVFLDDYKEQSFKKCIDVHEIAQKLSQEGFEISQNLMENLGNILMCFGEIEHELSYGERIPPESEEERRAKIVYEIKLKEREEARKDAEANGEIYVETEPLPIIKPKNPVLMLLHLVSITDLKFSG